MKRILPLAIVAAIATSQAACYGSYSATRSLHRWNGHATSSRVTNSVIHFVLSPVYGLFVFGDFFLLNQIEFVTGEPVFK
jgi:hypothetical protein